jgi:hypothetical protein
MMLRDQEGEGVGILTRARLGVLEVNARLVRIGRIGGDGAELCPVCNVKEDITHFVADCIKQEDIRVELVSQLRAKGYLVEEWDAWDSVRRTKYLLQLGTRPQAGSLVTLVRSFLGRAWGGRLDTTSGSGLTAPTSRQSSTQVGCLSD